MPNSTNPFLYVRASERDRTYIGGAFCSDEANFRDMFEQAPPEVAIDIEFGREAVQAGMPVEDTVQKYGLNNLALTGRRGTGSIVRDCLERIAAGQCAVYPMAPPDQVTEQSAEIIKETI